MGSRGLLRLTATRWGAAPAHAVSSWISSPSRRLSAAARSNVTCLQILHKHKHTNSTTRPVRSSTRIIHYLTLRPFFTQPGSSQPTGPGPGKPTRRRRFYLLALLALTLAIFNQSRKSDPRTALNKDRFTSCTVISNLPVSPTAFLITVQLPSLAANDTAVAAAWRHGLWSIEVKQPQLQIARHYTPLPGQAAGQLRLYVRRYDGGEVSTYLSRLRPRDPIEIRGPHLGFDLGARLGEEGRKVVFVAGGTGVAPALQAAEYVLGRDGVEVEVLCANRSGVDCAGCQRLPVERRGWFPRGTAVTDEKHLKEEPSEIVRQIRELQAVYEAKGRKLEVKCAVDNEGSMVKERDIMNAVGRTSQVHDASSLSCHFHSQQQLEHSTEESDVSIGGRNDDEKKVAVQRCTCVGEGAKGKNVFIISGPDGFVSAFVGPKVWANGNERQGPVGGMVSALMKANPQIWRNWLVLKQ